MRNSGCRHPDTQTFTIKILPAQWPGIIGQSSMKLLATTPALLHEDGHLGTNGGSPHSVPPALLVFTQFQELARSNDYSSLFIAIASWTGYGSWQVLGSRAALVQLSRASNNRGGGTAVRSTLSEINRANAAGPRSSQFFQDRFDWRCRQCD